VEGANAGRFDMVELNGDNAEVKMVKSGFKQPVSVWQIGKAGLTRHENPFRQSFLPRSIGYGIPPAMAGPHTRHRFVSVIACRARRTGNEGDFDVLPGSGSKSGGQVEADHRARHKGRPDLSPKIRRWQLFHCPSELARVFPLAGERNGDQGPPGTCQIFGGAVLARGAVRLA